MSHLTSEEIQQIAERRLRPERLIAMDRHLDECEDCRALLADTSGTGELSTRLRKNLSTLRHPAADLLAEYAEGRLSPSRREQVRTHLTVCDRCRADIADLEDVNRYFEGPPSQTVSVMRPGPVIPRASWWWALGLGALVCVAVGGALGVVVEHEREADRHRTEMIAWSQLHAELEASRAELQRVRSLLAEHRSAGSSRPPAPVIPPRTQVAELEEPSFPAPSAVTVRDGAGLLRMDPGGGAEWVRPLPAVVATAIREGVLPLPPAVARLTVSAETVRGTDAAAPGVSGLAPAATLVSEDRPVFRWTPVEAAVSYEVTIQSVSLTDAPLLRSGPITSTSWRPEAPLRRGEIYVWQVTAARSSGEVLATLPPLPRFRVADASLKTRAEQMRRDYAGSHLVVGVLLAAEGLLQEAEDELLQAREANASSRNLRRLLEQVVRHRQPASSMRKPSQAERK